MNTLWLLIGLVFGAGLAAALMSARIRSLAITAARAAEFERDLVQSRADLQHERARGEERLGAINDAQERLSNSFKALSAEALQASMAQLAELSRAQLQATQEQAKGDLDKRQQRGRAAGRTAEGAAWPRRRAAAARLTRSGVSLAADSRRN